MIPIRDDNPTRTTPYVVYALIALNVLFFVIDWAFKTPIHTDRGTIVVGGLWRFSMLPAQIVTGNNLLSAVFPSSNGIITVPHISPSPPWITIFTSMFMHNGLAHIGFNMLYLWIFGNNIEDTLGHIKFLIFYLVGGVIAAVAQIASNPTSLIPMLGASGAVAAVLGAYMVLYPRSRILCLVFFGFFVTTVAVPAVVVLGLWILLQFIHIPWGATTPTGGGVAYWAHVGGFLAGIIMILILGGSRLVQQYNQRSNRDNESW